MNESPKLIIAVDFDGTCVTHDFPQIGKQIGAAPVLRKLSKKGHKLILWTMRSDSALHNGLSDAQAWFERNGIPLWGIQTNPDQAKWTSSPKAYAQLYIDDAALGCPLKYEPEMSERPFADWEEIEKQLTEKNIL